MALRPPDPNETDLRYTTLDAIKGRLNIPLTDLAKDDLLTSSGVAAEWSIDVFCGRGFPDLADPEDPAIILIVPPAVVEAATQTAIAVYKEADAPVGTAGSESFMGAISVQDTTRRMLQRNPTLTGFRVSWGVA